MIASIRPSSSVGCAVADVIIALWLFSKAPSLFEWRRRMGIQQQADARRGIS